MSSFVLVHGGWHGAWCWRHVTPLLQDLGHTVAAPDLPGHGMDRTPPSAVTLASYVTRLSDLLDRQRRPVVLVGHSMSGMVITQAAEHHPDQIALLVYVTAFLPRNGQSLAGLVADDTESLITPNSVLSADQTAVSLRESGLVETFYADCPPDDVSVARTMLVAEPMAPLLAPVQISEARFGRIPRAYVACLRDRALPPARQQRMYAATPCGRVLSLNTGHSPFFADPAGLVQYLHALAQEAEKGSVAESRGTPCDLQ
jgi:pimeloyl-ACP methyl ester carboxylesterase